MDYEALDLDLDDDPILLDDPVHDAEELIESTLDENDVETEQIVLLDTFRADTLDDLDVVA